MTRHFLIITGIVIYIFHACSNHKVVVTKGLYFNLNYNLLSFARRQRIAAKINIAIIHYMAIIFIIGYHVAKHTIVSL